MGKFANELPGHAPRYLYPATEPSGDSGFDALGKPVPHRRRSAGDAHLKDMGFTSSEKRWDILARMCDSVARDDPHRALEDALEMGLDVTGCYRLLAVLLTAEDSPEPPPAPVEDTTYVDFALGTRATA